MPARTRLALLAALLGLTTPVLAQSGYDLDKTRRVLSEMIQKAVDSGGVPSISIALVKDDAIVWKAAFGFANVRTRTPATTETIYSTGSTFKSVTATALMQLAEQKKLALEHPVNRYLGDIQIADRLQSPNPVTIAHILSHWSGLVAGAVTKPIWGRQLPKSLETMVAGLYSVRAPEARWEYNNFAYGMAGLLVEKISGESYEQYISSHILQPLGVETPHPVEPSPEMVELMALPYLPGGSSGKPRPVRQVHYDVYPAGDIYLTPEDMARFLGAHLNGGTFNGKRILSKESIEAMHEPRFGGTYGLGFFLGRSEDGHRLISHSGGIPGQSSFMSGDLDARVGVYYMSNSGAPSEIAVAALALLQGKDYVPPPMRKTVRVQAKTLAPLVGEYELAPGFAVAVTASGDTLYYQQGPNPPARALVATGPDRFLDPSSGTYLVFERDASGKVVRMILDSAGQTIPAPRR